MCAHACLNVLFSRASDPISYSFFLLCSFWAAALCALRSRTGPQRKRRNWMLLASGFLLWFVGTILAAYTDVVAHGPSTVASWDDFFFFFSGVPFLLAIASPEDSRLFSLFFWLDVLQAGAAGWLTYLAVFGVLPFSRAAALPISTGKLVWLFAIEAFALAILGSARWAASPRGGRERQFFQVLMIYLWALAICQTEYNHLVLKYNGAGILDVLTDFPFLLFVFLAAFLVPAEAGPAEEVSRRPILMVLDHARPVLLGLALVALSAMVVRKHFAISISIIFASFVVYGIRSAVLQSRYVQSQLALEEARDRLEALAMQDGLTGIANRRNFDQRFQNEWRRGHRTRSPLSLLLIDIDYFKQLNDTYGHLIGDECLIQVARTLRSVLNRPGDLLARYGGEEFVALLPETDAMGARIVASRLQTVLRSSPPVDSVQRQVTVSIGATTWEGDDSITAEDILATADRALYQAKQNGRNHVEFFPLRSGMAG